MSHADMELVCGGQSFPCHKFVMGARSDVFRAMFSHDMKESQDGRVEVTDTSPEVVGQFLKFVYTDGFDDGGNFRTVSQLLPLAEKYNVKKLSNECGQKMLEVGQRGNYICIALVGRLVGTSVRRNVWSFYGTSTCPKETPFFFFQNMSLFLIYFFVNVQCFES